MPCSWLFTVTAVAAAAAAVVFATTPPPTARGPKSNLILYHCVSNSAGGVPQSQRNGQRYRRHAVTAPLRTFLNLDIIELPPSSSPRPCRGSTPPSAIFPVCRNRRLSSYYAFSRLVRIALWNYAGSNRRPFQYIRRDCSCCRLRLLMLWPSYGYRHCNQWTSTAKYYTAYLLKCTASRKKVIKRYNSILFFGTKKRWQKSNPTVFSKELGNVYEKWSFVSRKFRVIFTGNTGKTRQPTSIMHK